MEIELTDDEERECVELVDLLGMSPGELLLRTVRKRRENMRNPIHTVEVDEKTWDRMQLIRKGHPGVADRELLHDAVMKMSLGVRDKRSRRC